MLKKYNYMLTIILYPFILILSYLKLTNAIKSSFYTHLIIIMLVIFIPSFMMSLYSALEEILTSEKKWRIIFIVFLSIFYLPIYYTKYIAKEEKYLGYILFIITIPLTILTYNITCKTVSRYLTRIYEKQAMIGTNYIYLSANRLFTISVDESFRCNENDIGDYVVSCDRNEDDSFIGIYSYDVTQEEEEDITDKLDFHLGQTLDYIEESEFTYEMQNIDNIIEIDYNDNAILITQNNYLVNDIKYSLIILKEMPKELLSYDDYQKMIDSIYFLNYNEEVSS